MELKSSYVFDAPQARVWDLLMDTRTVASCVPGCRELRDLGEDRYQAELVVSIAAVTGNYGATIGIEDKNPPSSYRLVMQGTGRTGFVRGTALIALSPQDTRTVVEVTATADVGGTVARVGQRLLEGVGRMMMDRFFHCLQSKLA
ncbi:MAG TPA: carbon monoxide dehydrogenase subunit G [Vicinamibacterales bacterium]|jgi:carbon monoxide dehydrogenase subunit G|nr:carbon monoxide dehydrogenase subunit G [Vicinamibacterales bacterium]